MNIEKVRIILNNYNPGFPITNAVILDEIIACLPSNTEIARQLYGEFQEYLSGFEDNISALFTSLSFPDWLDQQD